MDEQLDQARALIKARRYSEARAILNKLDHPTARKWLQQLDQIAPALPDQETKTLTQRVLLILTGVMLLTMVLIAIYAITIIRGRSNDTNADPIAALPTVKQLPTFTSTATNTNIPTLTITPSVSATPKPISTSTETPLPSKTPEPTPSPIAGCLHDDAWYWAGKMGDIGEMLVKYMKDFLVDLTTESLDKAINGITEQYNVARLTPYPECLVTARGLFLRYIENGLSAIENKRKGDKTTADSNVESMKVYFELYIDEMKKALPR